MVPFFGKRKATPKSIGSDVKLDKTDHTAPVDNAKRPDSGYFLAKYQANCLLPGWTGFNQLLSRAVPPTSLSRLLNHPEKITMLTLPKILYVQLSTLIK